MKSAHNPDCIDFVLTNIPGGFFKTETFFTGLSGFHKLIVNVLKTTFSKSKPKEIIHRDFKKLNGENLNQELSLKLTNKCLNNYSSFEIYFLETLNNHVLEKEKLLRANYTPYITKTFLKAILRRSNLETKNSKTRKPKSLNNTEKRKNTVEDCTKRNAKHSSTT